MSQDDFDFGAQNAPPPSREPIVLRAEYAPMEVDRTAATVAIGEPGPLARLRAPFGPDEIEKLPKPTKKDNERGRCNECGGWHGLPAVHLDYIGHARVTSRLLDVDPNWNWRPLATVSPTDPRPAFDTDGRGNPVGLWIELEVLGVKRLGYGSCSPGDFDAVKQLIGDAIRNAAMRFGVALNLWMKEPVLQTDDGQERRDRQPAAQAGNESGWPDFWKEATRLGLNNQHIERAIGHKPTLPEAREFVRLFKTVPNHKEFRAYDAKGKADAVVYMAKLWKEEKGG